MQANQRKPAFPVLLRPKGRFFRLTRKPEAPFLFKTLERKAAREMYFRNFSVRVIRGPHRERTFALDRFYQVLAVHSEDSEFTKTHVLLEDDNHSLRRVSSNEVTEKR